MIQTPKQRAAAIANLRGANLMDPKKQRATRLRQLDHEESEAEKMRAEGYEVFSPTVVCDRVAVKDGKVYFVEFKQPGQGLRPGQRRIQELVPDRYLIKVSAL